MDLQEGYSVDRVESGADAALGAEAAETIVLLHEKLGAAHHYGVVTASSSGQQQLMGLRGPLPFKHFLKSSFVSSPRVAMIGHRPRGQRTNERRKEEI